MTRVSRTLYRANDGRMLVRKSDGKIMGDGVDLGVDDSINNYEELEFTAEERSAFWESIGMRDPKIRLEPPRLPGREEGSNE